MTLQKLDLKYDTELKIATGASRKSTKWVNADMKWSELAARLSVPQRTAETVSEYQRMPKPKKDVCKDVGGFVAGVVAHGRRKAENITSRYCITLDADSVPAGVDLWTMWELMVDRAAVCYSTHSHTPDAPRLRLVIPLARKVSPDEYGAISRRIAQQIGIDYFDDTTYEPHRLMYWPSAPIDGEFIFKVDDAQLLDPDEVLDTYDDWTDTTQWPVSSRQQEAMAAHAKKQGDPTEKPGVVGAFCKIYDVPAAIDKFIPEVYTPAGKGRYTYAAGSTTGGVVLYDDGAFSFSHHGTDPASGQLVNAFDLVRLQLFSDADEDAQPGTPVTKLASYREMTKLVLADPQASYQLALDRVGDAFDEVEEETGQEVDTSWLQLMDKTDKGLFKSTIHNYTLILEHDPRLVGQYFYDAFRERPMVSGDLPWVELEDRETAGWSDADDAGLRRYIEDVYGIDSAAKLKDGVEIAMLHAIRHPVREYLESLTWDGEKRMEDLFITYLGAEDCRYTRAVTRAALIGAVARIYRPGCKHDHMLVLVGPQGCRKSTTLAKLGKEWFSDSLYTVAGKDAYEQIQGAWIVEMGELAATRKAEAEQIKQFMSKQTDTYRAAYARRTKDHPRQCAFFGSTNDVEFLRDYTGARRFWPVDVDNTGRRMADKIDAEIVDQIWAEAVAAYKAGAKWYLTDDEEDEARQVQEEHTEVSGKLGVVQEFAERMVPADWYERSLEDRRAFWSDAWDEHEAESDLVPRTKICALEVWCELFGGEAKNYDQQKARELNNLLGKLPFWQRKGTVDTGRVYGVQRGFKRKL